MNRSVCSSLWTNRFRTFLFLSVLAMWLVATPIQTTAQTESEYDWPQWRGPERNNLSTETGVLDRWPEGGPERLWLNREAGLGYSGFSVVGSHLYTMGQENDEQFVLCLDVGDGSVVWKTITGPGFENGWGDGPRSTPTVDGDHLFALDAIGNLVCLERDTGETVWHVNLARYGGQVPTWGYSESVLVDGDQVVCTPGGTRGAIAAFDKRTGEHLWQMDDYTEVAHYASLVAADVNGQRQYVQLMQSAILGVSPDGRLLWREDWPGRTAVIPSPIVHDNAIYVTSGYGVGSRKIEVDDRNVVQERWYSREMKNHHGGVILYEGHVYGYSDSVGWICQDWETGEIVWRNTRDLEKGAISYIDGKFILLGEDTGQVVMIEASSEEWNELGRFTLSPQTERRKPRGRIWVHPIVSNGRLFLRDQELIYCYDVSGN